MNVKPVVEYMMKHISKVVPNAIVIGILGIQVISKISVDSNSVPSISRILPLKSTRNIVVVLCSADKNDAVGISPISLDFSPTPEVLTIFK